MRRALLGALALAVLLAVGGLIFIYSGLYNVAATRPHFDFTWWLLDTVKVHSIRRAANSIRVPEHIDLSDEALAFRAAGAFETGCATCHGAPGRKPDQLGRGLNPEPPDLQHPLHQWSAPELFWIVKHGIKFTGMPGWAETHRDDEVWAMVAVILRLPEMSAAEYAAWTRPQSQLLDSGGVAGLAARACAACHGADGAGSGEVPRLAGQAREYLLASLERYASGARPSGIMQPVSRALSEKERERLAAYYAGLYARPKGQAADRDGRLLQQGGVISAAGLAEAGVQACVACHPHTPAPGQTIPSLVAQPAGYTALQLRLWRDGVRTEPPMREIAARLSEQQIRALAAYFASLP